jgi:hypothetical protein
MTAKELIQAIESAGGTLEAKGDNLACEIPPEVEHLVPELQANKPAVMAILRRRNPSPPWPGYNGDQFFVCGKCGCHFDTSAGYAQHQVYDCKAESGGLGWALPTSASHRDDG